MKLNANMQVGITDHAYEQYCARVGPIGRGELEQECQQLFRSKEYRRCNRQLLRLGRTWWAYEVNRRGTSIWLTTCYGQTDLYLPSALHWQIKEHDRVQLSGDGVFRMN